MNTTQLFVWKLVTTYTYTIFIKRKSLYVSESLAQELELERKSRQQAVQQQQQAAAQQQVERDVKSPLQGKFGLELG